jgi:hypothetical protein
LRGKFLEPYKRQCRAEEKKGTKQKKTRNRVTRSTRRQQQKTQKNQKINPKKTELKKGRENRAQIQIHREGEDKRAEHGKENYP